MIRGVGVTKSGVGDVTQISMLELNKVGLGTQWAHEKVPSRLVELESHGVKISFTVVLISNISNSGALGRAVGCIFFLSC